MRNLIYVLIAIIDLEGKFVIGKCLEVEDEILDYFALWFDIVLILACVLKAQFDVGTADILADYGVL